MPTVSRIDHAHGGEKSLTKYQIESDAAQNALDKAVFEEACRRQRHTPSYWEEASIEYWRADDDKDEGYAIVTLRAGHGGPGRSPVAWKLKVWLHHGRIVKGRMTSPKRLGRRLAKAS